MHRIFGIGFVASSATGWRATTVLDPVVGRRAHVVASAAIDVELLQFLPMMPPLAPGAEAAALLTVEGATFASPAWVPSVQGVAVLDDREGQQYLLDAHGTTPLIPSGVWAHAAIAGAPRLRRSDGAPETAAIVLVVGGFGGELSCVGVEEDELGTAATLPVVADDLGSSVLLLTPLSNGRLLAVLEDGRLLCLSAGEEPATLLSGVADICGASISSDDRSLYLCVGGGVSRCALDLDAGECAPPEPIVLEVTKEVTGIAIDRNDNLFVCTAEGVTVCNESGDAVARATTPAPVAGCCFGGSSLNDLYVAAGDTIWRLKTNSQGVRPPSAAFIKKMDKLSAAGEFRHVGW